MQKLKKILRLKNYFNPKFSVFYYHRIKTATAEEILHGKLLGYEFSLDPQAFENQVRVIASRHKIISVDDVMDGRIPDDSVLLTFDDGYRDIYTNAFPILKKYKIPAVVFLITDFVGTDRPFWWDELIELIFKTAASSFENHSLATKEDRLQFLKYVLLKFHEIGSDQKGRYFGCLKSALGPVDAVGDNLSWGEVREMRKGGICFGSHTRTHPVLTQVTREEALREIADSKSKIERELGETVDVFSYPHGEYNSAVKAIVKRSGYRCAFTVNSHANRAGDDLFELGRTICP